MYKVILSTLLLMLIATTSSAENSIRPGLWEITTKSDLLAQVPRLSPQQMDQIAVLVKRHGMEMPKIENNAMTSRVCITPEMAQQDTPTYFYENQSGCVVMNATQSDNQYRVDLVCENAQFKGNGVAEGSFASSESFAGTTTFDSVATGKSVHITTETSGRWIGENCAAVDL